MISNLQDGYIELPYDRVVIDVMRFHAILIDFDVNKIKWIPRSHIHDMFEDREGKTVILTEWIAKKKGLI